MNFTTVDSIEVVLLGRERRLRLSLMTPTWYKAITHKPLTELIMLLQHQLQAGSAAARVNQAHADALGIPVEELPPDEMVDVDSLLSPEDNVDTADMVPDVVAAVYALAHWEDVLNRPQGHKDTAQPGELTYEDLNCQLDLDSYPMLLLLIIEVWQKHMMKPGKDTATPDDPNAKSLTPSNSGASGMSSSDSLPTTS